MKKAYKYVLSVDFEGGDGPDYFPIEEKGRSMEKSRNEIDRMFTELLFASYPPPKVEVIGLTEKQWKKAVENGRRDS